MDALSRFKQRWQSLLDWLSQPVTDSDGREHPRHLKRELNKWPILMIVLSTTVGVGFFASSAEILALAGPAATVLAFGVVGMVAVAVMKGISEMVMIWQVRNPMVEFVRYMVDRDLATVVGISYWYCYGVSSAAVVATAGDIVQYWAQDETARILVFLLFPVLVLFINNFNVRFFGNVELFGGSLKLGLILILGISVYVSIGSGSHVGASNIRDGFQYRPEAAPNKAIATLISISLAVYPYLGVESVTVLALEAKNAAELRLPAKYIATFTLLLYMFSVIGFVLAVKWTNPYLPRYYNQWTGHADTVAVSFAGHAVRRDTSTGNATAGNLVAKTLPTLALEQGHMKSFAGVVNGFLLYSALSTANSAFFVACRTLAGLAQNSQEGTDASFFVRFFAKLSYVDNQGVPRRAVFATMIFAWAPFLSVRPNWAAGDVQQVLFSIGSTTCVLVWASQALAFLFYYYGLRKHYHKLRGSYAKYDRWAELQGPHRDSLSLLRQPRLAWFSLISSILIVLVFAGLGLIERQNATLKAANFYLGPGIGVLMYLILKVYRGGRIIPSFAVPDWQEFKTTLDNLEEMSRHGVEDQTYEMHGQAPPIYSPEAGPEAEQTSPHRDGTERHHTEQSQAEKGEDSEPARDSST